MEKIQLLLNNIGIPSEYKDDLHDPLLSFLCSHPCLSSSRIEKYISSHNDDYDQSKQTLADYIIRHDNKNIESWKYYLGISDEALWLVIYLLPRFNISENSSKLIIKYDLMHVAK